MVETAGAIVRFKKVVSLLNSGLGHARVRKHKKLQIPFLKVFSWTTKFAKPIIIQNVWSFLIQVLLRIQFRDWVK